MSHIFGGFKLFDSLKITFFIGFTAQYFVTFFIEHPVYIVTSIACYLMNKNKIELQYLRIQKMFVEPKRVVAIGSPILAATMVKIRVFVMMLGRIILRTLIIPRLLITINDLVAFKDTPAINLAR